MVELSSSSSPNNEILVFLLLIKYESFSWMVSSQNLARLLLLLLLLQLAPPLPVFTPPSLLLPSLPSSSWNKWLNPRSTTSPFYPLPPNSNKLLLPILQFMLDLLEAANNLRINNTLTECSIYAMVEMLSWTVTSPRDMSSFSSNSFAESQSK